MMSDDEDPFERLDDTVGEREGDPFESIAATDEESADESTDDRPAAATGADPHPAPDPPGAEGAEFEPDDVPGDPTLGDVDERIGDPFDSMDGVFEEMDVASLDADAVWQGLESAQTRGSVKDVERTYADVNKHTFCEGCEHFSKPPAVSCAHEGTEIIEFLDMETVRVVDCPVVAERHEIEAGE